MHNQILNWILKNRNKYSIQFETREWAKELGSNFCNVVCKIKFENFYNKGFGTDVDENTALLKSFSECIEHQLVNELKLSSTNGIAVHSNEHIAERLAMREAVERDCFFRFFYLDQSSAKLLNSDPIFKMGSKLYFPVDQMLLLLPSTILEEQKLYTVMCIGRVQYDSCNSSISVGLGTSDTLEESSEKAQIESWRNIYPLAQHKHPIVMDLKKFLSLRLPGPLDHLELCNCPEYASSIWDIVCKKVNPIVFERKISRSEIVFEKLKSKILEETGLVAVKASSKDFIDLHFGRPNEELIARFPEVRNFSAIHPLA